MMMIMVIILMLDDDNAQKSSTTMTLWSKYTPFKYYYLVKKKGPNQPGRGRPLPPLNGPCPFKNVFFIWTPSLKHAIMTFDCSHCEFNAKVKQTLKRHIKSTHENIRFDCNCCEYRTTPKQSLKTHIQAKLFLSKISIL